MTIVHYKNDNGISSVEINPNSSNLNKGEFVVFSSSIQKGFINKHLAKLYCISNYRVFEWNAERSAMDAVVLMQDLEDCIVWNSRRIRTGSYAGGYSTLFRGIGVSSGYTNGTSFNLGDVVFMVKGKPVLIWSNTTNPSELKRLVLTIKKQCYPKKELDRFINGIRSDMLPRSVCLCCGTKNVKNASFCSNCGAVLR